MEPADLHDLVAAQAGVVSAAQLRAREVPHGDVERWLRRRQVARVHPRVLVTHTGPLTWLQRSWAAVLWAEPAALALDSAVRIGDDRRHATTRDDGPIHVVVDSRRRLSAVPGVQVHRTRHLAARVVDLGPPRVRLEEALLDLAEVAGTDLDAVGVLSDACGARRTTAERLLDHAALRPRLARRARIVAVLGDVATGTCSALEQAYLDAVVRPHGLPEGDRQASHRHEGDQRYRDVLLAEHRLCVELDGRVVHGSSEARDLDLERDLDAAAEDDLLTVRLSWGQVVDRGCRTAQRLGRLLHRRGWDGAALVCDNCPPAAAGVRG